MASQSDESSEESGSTVSTEEEEEEEEDDEPVLKYKRFAKEVVNSLSQSGAEGEPKNVIICMAVHPKFIALGTYDGSVKLLDHSGTLLKDREYHLHGAQINHISVDEEGDFMACCSDDGKISIVGLFTAKYNNSIQFEKAVKSVAIHPHFGRATNRVFVAGLDRVLLVEERRWPLIGYKTTDVQFGYGIVNVIKWRDNYIAWANEKSVFVYDVSIKDFIACIKFEEESPTVLPCSLCWVKNGMLLVGRGHLVKLAEVKEAESMEASTDYPGGMDPLLRKKKKMAIIAQNTFPEFLVCGVVPIVDNSDWNMVVLGYDANVNQEEAIHKGTIPAPHLLVVPPGHYSPKEEQFQVMPEIARDKLLPRGYSFCRCTEYHLECVLTGDEDRFYVLTPIDIILAQKTDCNDHIDWLTKRNRFAEAMEFAENPVNIRHLHTGKLQETGLLYIYHLMKTHKFKEAAMKCCDVLGPNDGQRWEDIIYDFLENKVIPILLPYIPKRNPQLSQATYEMVLNYFLLNDTEELYKIIHEWSSVLYDPAVIMSAVNDQLKKHQNETNLLKVKAKLFEDMGDPDSALEIFLRLGDVEVFDLIRKKNLHAALIDNIEYLMNLGEKQLQKTVELLVEFRRDDCIPPSKVVKKLESFRGEKNCEYFLHRYLDTLFDKDPKAGGEYHERQLQLYAEYNQKKLLFFLRACNDYPLQKALDVCAAKGLHEAMVFLLNRMGNPKSALEIIVKKLHNVEQAISFVRENDDEDLWDTLIMLSKNLPDFITGLLQNAGTHIDPTKLIKAIPDQLKIDQLGLSLVKLLNDYQLQVNLREGCRKILVKDSHDLMEKLCKLHNKATAFDRGAKCLNCSGELSTDIRNDHLIMFFCGHIYHQSCVSHKNELDICHVCYRSSSNSLKLRQPLRPS